jgi:hypothetical protein
MHFSPPLSDSAFLPNRIRSPFLVTFVSSRLRSSVPEISAGRVQEKRTVRQTRQIAAAALKPRAFHSTGLAVHRWVPAMLGFNPWNSDFRGDRFIIVVDLEAGPDLIALKDIRNA